MHGKVLIRKTCDKYDRLMSFIDKGELKFQKTSKTQYLDTAIYSLIGLILYEESREKSKTGEQPTEEHIKQQQDHRHDQSPFIEEQCLLFPDQQREQSITQ